ncbi:ABC transporter substrate-binding protein [Paenibacillus donghaensis]|uniref:Sugar ABC transporter substrate-binding protein n=1 Tax=Paenibacillus donghaensis TaxID=414771 RepID=A0A2Z2K5Q4_9BACL|nr:extracellular solute-binding protein [Paenibacillus donghaensis]ASA19957.1 sugar ABC transporter substrate-binding protein [Paenibacillus donghaensis]
MKKSKTMMGLMALTLTTGLFAGCSSNNNANTGNEQATNNAGAGTEATTTPAGEAGQDLKGEITVITQRTDIVDTVFKDYAAKFNEKYPDVKVNFEALTTYEDQIKIRMSTEDYGDVLLLPTSVAIKDMPDFFEPLGQLAEMEQQYTGLEERAVDGVAYGIPITINYTGVIYNKKVFQDAGITEVPKTIDQFMTALQSIKDKTEAVPIYTNYAAGWPLTQWESVLPTVAGSRDYVNITQLAAPDNFTPGQPHYDLYKVMYDAAQKGLIEEDPTTTDWESSKADLANGKIGTMVLGSWAIGQIKGVATNPDDIGFMPFPTNADTILVPLADDYNIGVSVHSKHKEAARAWVDFFINDSTYPTTEGGGMSPVKGAELPEILKQFEGTDVTFDTITPAQAGKEGWVDRIDKDAEVGLWQPDFKKFIIEAAIGNRKDSFDDIMKDLNDKWAASYAKVTAAK